MLAPAAVRPRARLRRRTLGIVAAAGVVLAAAIALRPGAPRRASVTCDDPSPRAPAPTLRVNGIPAVYVR